MRTASRPISIPRRGVACAAAVLTGACTVLQPEPPAAQAPAPARVEPAAPLSPPAGTNRDPRREARRAPIPDRPIDIRADCSFRDETGYGGRMKLVVADSQVRAFEATVEVPSRGACRFQLADFRQVKAGTQPELAANGSACVVRLWRQASRVTVAFDRCEPMCSGGAYPYLWPILADARKGSCG